MTAVSAPAAVQLSDRAIERLRKQRKTEGVTVDPSTPTDRVTSFGVDRHGNEWVEHRPGCQCGVELGWPASMRDERWLTSSFGRTFRDGGMFGYLLFQRFVAEAAATGRPVARIQESRRNDEGEPIGPRLEVRSCESRVFLEVLHKIADYADQALAEAVADLQ